jgi:K+-sensing histidine kinase KdpD
MIGRVVASMILELVVTYHVHIMEPKGVQEMKKEICFVSMIIMLGTSLMLSQVAAQQPKPAAAPKVNQGQTMKNLAAEWKLVKETLEKNNLAATQRSLQKIFETIPAIENFTPPKNADKRDAFVENYRNLTKNLTLLRNAVDAQNSQAAGGLTGVVEGTCKSCHGTFRS